MLDFVDYTHLENVDILHFPNRPVAWDVVYCTDCFYSVTTDLVTYQSYTYKEWAELISEAIIHTHDPEPIVRCANDLEIYAGIGEMWVRCTTCKFWQGVGFEITIPELMKLKRRHEAGDD